MKVLVPGIRPEKGCVVTIGAFDGVHVGHQALIAQTRQRADQLGCSSVVVTFDRHPASVVRPQSAPRLLTDIDQKLELLAATGVDYTLVLRFDEARAAEPAEDFVREILIDRLDARAIVVGYDFHFGRGRAGNVSLLRSMGASLGFDVDEVKPVDARDGTVSSTRVRESLMSGDVEHAAEMLGRPYELRGLVVMGDGRGRELGYPTANVHVSNDALVPGDGVYGGHYVMPDGSVYDTAISVGTRPTFYEDGASLVEAHVLDFDGDLYGQHAVVRFTSRIRGQERFDSLDDLIKQIEADVDDVRARSTAR